MTSDAPGYQATRPQVTDDGSVAGMLQQHAAAQAELVRSVLHAEVEQRLSLWQGIVVNLRAALPDHRHNQAHPQNGLHPLSQKRSLWWCIRERATVLVG